MNNKDFQKTQGKISHRPIQQSQNKSPRPTRQLRKVKFWNFLSEAANPFQILAVISMFVFGGLIRDLRLPEIPALLCFATCFLFLIRSRRKDSFEWLTLIWFFNAIIWTCNFIFLT